MSKNNKNPTNAEDIKAWEDFKNQKFLDGDKGEISKKSLKGNKKQDHIDFKIDLHGYSLQESFEKMRGVIENCYQKDLRNILIITGKFKMTGNETIEEYQEIKSEGEVHLTKEKAA